MSSPASGVAAAWATRADVCAPCAEPPVGTVAVVENTTMDRWLLFASNVLYAMTGRRWSGVVTGIKVRPIPRIYGDGSPCPVFGSGSGSLGSFDYRFGGPWLFSARGPLTRGGSVSEITLGAYPLVAVTEVKIDGTVLSPAAYRIDDYRWLVRTDGNAWPVGQNMNAADTETGTFSVTFSGGARPPQDGVVAAAALACELALASIQDNRCRLPRKTQTATRQGLSFTFYDPSALFSDGSTGVPEVDLFLAAHPHKRSRAAVYSPDIPRPVRRTTG